MSYNYNNEVLNDVHNAIQDYDLSEYRGDREGFEELLNDELSSGNHRYNHPCRYSHSSLQSPAGHKGGHK